MEEQNINYNYIHALINWYKIVNTSNYDIIASNILQTKIKEIINDDNFNSNFFNITPNLLFLIVV
jgi:hypothetical protein